MFGRGFKLSLSVFFTLFIVFLYGPTLSILVLSFQGPNGGLTFPMRGFSTFWFESLFDGVGVIDIWGAFGRSIRLGLVVMGSAYGGDGHAKDCDCGTRGRGSGRSSQSLIA